MIALGVHETEALPLLELSRHAEDGNVVVMWVTEELEVLRVFGPDQQVAHPVSFVNCARLLDRDTPLMSICILEEGRLVGAESCQAVVGRLVVGRLSELLDPSFLEVFATTHGMQAATNGGDASCGAADDNEWLADVHRFPPARDHMDCDQVSVIIAPL